MRRRSTVLVFVLTTVCIAGCSKADPAPQTAAPISVSAPTADQAIAAFRSAGLSVPNMRDNTEGNCRTIKCTRLISTDSYSVYEWPDDAAAARWAAASGMRVARANRVVVRFAVGGSAIEVDPAPYERVLADLATASG